MLLLESDRVMAQDNGHVSQDDESDGFLQSLQSFLKDFQTYSNGEELFGLPVTDHPELKRIRKELNLLQKLYSLYNLVMDSIDGYYDILWTEVSTA